LAAAAALLLINAAALTCVRSLELTAATSFSYGNIFACFTLRFIVYPRLVGIPTKRIFPARQNAFRPDDCPM
jgi:hypothetical protein